MYKKKNLIPNKYLRFFLQLFGINLNVLSVKSSFLKKKIPSILIFIEILQSGVLIVFLFQNKSKFSNVIELEREITTSIGMIMFYRNRKKFTKYLIQMQFFIEDDDRKILSRWCKKIILIYILAVTIELIILIKISSLKEIFESFLPSQLLPSSPYFEFITFYIILRQTFLSHGWAYLMILFYIYIFLNVHFVYKKFYTCCQNSDASILGDNYRLHHLRFARRKLQYIKRNLDHCLSSFPALLFVRSFIESCLCIIKASKRNEKMSFFLFFDDWTVYTITTIFLIGMTMFIDMMSKLEMCTTNCLLLRVLSNHRNNLDCRLEEIIFSQELMRFPFVPITVGGLFNICIGSLLLFYDSLIPFAFMSLNIKHV